MNKTHSQHGFTLTELITIIVILGILSVAALPRFFDSDAFQQRGAADQVMAALRFAQKVAVAQHRAVSVTLAQGPDTDCTTTLTGGNLSCTIETVLTGAGVYTFDALGRPSPNAQATIGIGGTTITIEEETGYVH